MKKLMILFFLLIFTITSNADCKDKLKVIPEKEDSLKIEPWMTSKSVWRQHKRHDRKLYKKNRGMRNYHDRREFIKKDD